MRAVPTARWGVLAVGVFAVAVALRLGFVLGSTGGATGNFGYDPSVYYSAADALIHGRLPYRDFVLLHPPGLMIALTPFAWLGRLTTDDTGFVAANTALSIIGSFNAALVVLVARRIGLTRFAAVLGAGFYAVWDGTVTSEISARLEPLGTLAFLCGLLLLLPPERAGRRRMICAGVAFGAATCVKIWWVVPVLVVGVWLLASPATRRRVPQFAAGVVLAVVAVDGPFLVLAPTAMFHMVVTDQLGRPRLSHSGLIYRLASFSSLRSLSPHASSGVLTVVVAAMLAVAGILVFAAWRIAPARIVVAVFGAQIVVLLAAPTYFSYYSGYPAATLSLLLAAAAHSIRRAGRIRWWTAAGAAASSAVVIVAAAVTACALFRRPDNLITPFPGPTLASRVAHLRCVIADSPMALIELDALSRDLANGCPDWVDVSGRTYGVDAPPHDESILRSHNEKWQADLRSYLLSGNATIIIRPDTGFSVATRRMIDRLPVLTRDDGVTIFRVPDADR